MDQRIYDEAVATAQARFFEIVHVFAASPKPSAGLEKSLLAEALAYAAVVFACRGRE